MTSTVCNTASETVNFAIEMAKSAQNGDVICLCGELGAGKTVFAQGFAQGLQITQPVNSPTFTLLREYTGGTLNLYHFDLYRLCEFGNDSLDYETLEEIGFFDYLGTDGVCLIEWANFAKEFIPKQAQWLNITRLKNESRKIQKI
ncbi:MAG: tRNA (adenosine(37)-N6)-threonylcarbamoyltransferase complex ATPase subunit type 1 TsaE [Firmicutes bacterium]|nr:tRNA (adenosine(37)-N6)-threonylcarbamoyltransferase complex ATPase subunit type 1 TsaE [Bacillota bacterium]